MWQKAFTMLLVVATGSAQDRPAALGQMSASSAPGITVRLLEPSGRPIAQETLWIQFHIAKVAELQTLEVTTGADGAAKVDPPQPIPSQFSVYPKYTETLYPCSQLLPVDTQQVIAAGIVSRCSKGTPGCRCKFGRRVAQLIGRPGELLFFRPPNLLERFGRNVWE